MRCSVSSECDTGYRDTACVLHERLDCDGPIDSEPSTIKMETVRYSETLVLTYQDTMCHNPEDSNAHVISDMRTT
jgi:hypothetical protein